MLDPANDRPARAGGAAATAKGDVSQTNDESSRGQDQGDSETSTTSTADPETSGEQAIGPGEAHAIDAFDRMSIDSDGEDDNHRAVDRERERPPARQTLAGIEALFSLDRYNRLCDHWDRRARIHVVANYPQKGTRRPR